MTEFTPSQWFWMGVMLLGFLGWLDILFVNYLNQQIRRAKWRWFCYRRKIGKIRKEKRHGN